MDPLTVTELRANIYRIIDEVIRTGEPRRITRGGEAVYLTPKPAKAARPAKGKKKKILNDLSKIKPLKDLLVEEPDYYNHIEWNTWKPAL